MERRLAAILAADALGYSQLIRANEEGTLTSLHMLSEAAIDPAISRKQGRIVKQIGDGILVEFASMVDAVRSVTDIQRVIAAMSDNMPKFPRCDSRARRRHPSHPAALGEDSETQSKFRSRQPAQAAAVSESGCF